MKKETDLLLVLVTVPNHDAAEQLTKQLLERRAVACVNRIPGIVSSYWWNDCIETSNEELLVIKTLREQLSAVEAIVVSEHEYDTPEIVAIGADSVNEKYLSWVGESVREKEH